MARQDKPVHRRGRPHTMAVFMRDQILTGLATALHVTTVPDGVEEVRVQRFVPDPQQPPDADGVRGRMEDEIVIVPKRRLVAMQFDEKPGRPDEVPNDGRPIRRT